MPKETAQKIMKAVSERVARFTRSENDPPPKAEDVPLGDGIAERGRRDAKKLATKSQEAIERDGG